MAYEVVGSLKRLGPALEQAVNQIGAGMTRSLQVVDAYQDDGPDPAQAVARAVGLLDQAGQHASALGVLLERAQQAIAAQGYHDRPGTV